jgi:Tn7-like transposition protein D
VPRRPASPRFDWEARDATLAAKVGPAALAVLAKRPLVRVSMRSLETEIDRPNCIYIRKAKLPQTVAAVAAHEESLEAFQKRRIAWAIEELREATRRVTVSSVMRLATVKDEWKAYVEKQIALPLSVRRDDLTG